MSLDDEKSDIIWESGSAIPAKPYPLRKPSEKNPEKVVLIILVVLLGIGVLVGYVSSRQYAYHGEVLESPLGARAGAHTTDYWVINIVAGNALQADLRFQLQQGGALVSSYHNVMASEARWDTSHSSWGATPYSLNPIVWLDNNGNGIVDSGDSIRIYRGDLVSGSYTFMAIKYGSPVLTFTLTKS